MYIPHCSLLTHLRFAFATILAFGRGDDAEDFQQTNEESNPKRNGPNPGWLIGSLI